MLTQRETAIKAMIAQLAAAGQSSTAIATTVSKFFNNYTMPGVVKLYLTGQSSCDPATSLRNPR